MIIEGKLRKWGNSYGITIPKKEAKKEGIGEGDEVKAFVKKKSEKVLKKHFGTIEETKSTQQIMDEMDEELYPNG